MNGRVRRRALASARDGDTSFAERQIDAAKALLPFALPKLQAIAVKHEEPEEPAILAQFADLPVETLEILRDALALASREIGRANAPVIDEAKSDSVSVLPSTGR